MVDSYYSEVPASHCSITLPITAVAVAIAIDIAVAIAIAVAVAVAALTVALVVTLTFALVYPCGQLLWVPPNMHVYYFGAPLVLPCPPRLA